jgi:hypothetical protein
LAASGYLILEEVETPTDNLRGKVECLGTGARIYQKNVGFQHWRTIRGKEGEIKSGRER